MPNNFQFFTRDYFVDVCKTVYKNGSRDEDIEFLRRIITGLSMYFKIYQTEYLNAGLREVLYLDKKSKQKSAEVLIRILVDSGANNYKEFIRETVNNAELFEYFIDQALSKNVVIEWDDCIYNAVHASCPVNVLQLLARKVAEQETVLGLKLKTNWAYALRIICQNFYSIEVAKFVISQLKSNGNEIDTRIMNECLAELCYSARSVFAAYTPYSDSRKQRLDELVQLINLLISNGANNMNSCLYDICYDSVWVSDSSASNDSMITVVKTLIDRGADNFHECLFESCKKNRIELVKLFLAKCPDDNFNDCLQVACYLGRHEVVKILLKDGLIFGTITNYRKCHSVAFFEGHFGVARLVAKAQLKSLFV
jgi:hypothetical protein